jgi:transposase-like protein
MVSFKGAHFPKDIILTCVRWYLACPLRSRHIEELKGCQAQHPSDAGVQIVRCGPVYPRRC